TQIPVFLHPFEGLSRSAGFRSVCLTHRFLCIVPRQMLAAAASAIRSTTVSPYMCASVLRLNTCPAADEFRKRFVEQNSPVIVSSSSDREKTADWTLDQFVGPF